LFIATLSAAAPTLDAPQAMERLMVKLSGDTRRREIYRSTSHAIAHEGLKFAAVISAPLSAFLAFNLAGTLLFLISAAIARHAIAHVVLEFAAVISPPLPAFLALNLARALLFLISAPATPHALAHVALERAAVQPAP
jgi:hypothetical protein